MIDLLRAIFLQPLDKHCGVVVQNLPRMNTRKPLTPEQRAILIARLPRIGPGPGRPPDTPEQKAEKRIIRAASDRAFKSLEKRLGKSLVALDASLALAEATADPEQIPAYRREARSAAQDIMDRLGIRQEQPAQAGAMIGIIMLPGVEAVADGDVVDVQASDPEIRATQAQEQRSQRDTTDTQKASPQDVVLSTGQEAVTAKGSM